MARPTEYQHHLEREAWLRQQRMQMNDYAAMEAMFRAMGSAGESLRLTMMYKRSVLRQIDREVPRCPRLPRPLSDPSNLSLTHPTFPTSPTHPTSPTFPNSLRPTQPLSDPSDLSDPSVRSDSDPFASRKIHR
jgi:hypothetical protein